MMKKTFCDFCPNEIKGVLLGQARRITLKTQDRRAVEFTIRATVAEGVLSADVYDICDDCISHMMGQADMRPRPPNNDVAYDEKAIVWLTSAEIQSNYNRVHAAEHLIMQLPKNHDGASTWLMNYGITAMASKLRHDCNVTWNETARAADTVDSTAR